MHVFPGEHPNTNVTYFFLYPRMMIKCNGQKPCKPPLELNTVNPLPEQTAALEAKRCESKHADEGNCSPSQGNTLFEK